MGEADMIWLEFLKLCVQLAGALIIARFAVNWALDRYKREKLWERRLASYADVVSALGEMLRINAEWYEEAINRRDQVKADEREQRYKAAKRKLDEVTAVGQLLLPSRAVMVLHLLHSDLRVQPRHHGYEDALDWQGETLSKALHSLIDIGREDLSINFVQPCPDH